METLTLFENTASEATPKLGCAKEKSQGKIMIKPEAMTVTEIYELHLQLSTVNLPAVCLLLILRWKCFFQTVLVPMSTQR